MTLSSRLEPTRFLESEPDPSLPIQTVAGVVLLRKDNSALMQLRDDKPGLNAAGLWVFPGGHSEPGESTESAARREFLEETGYTCGELRWVTRFSYPGDDGQVIYRLEMYVTPYDGVHPVYCYEGQAMQFIPRDRIWCYPMPPYIPSLWDLAIEAHGRLI